MTYDWRSSGRVPKVLDARLLFFIARLFRQGCTAHPQLLILTTNFLVLLTRSQGSHDSLVSISLCDPGLRAYERSCDQLYPHLHAPSIRNGHFLLASSPPPSRNQEEILPFPS